MPQTYRFQVSLPVTDTLPRNRMVNQLHFQHTLGALLDTDLEDMCGNILDLYALKYNNTGHEIEVKAYDTDAKPNYPRARVVVNTGSVWTCSHPREVALVVSFAGVNRGNKSERGRIYTMPQIVTGISYTGSLRPSPALMAWGLSWLDVPNESLPDLGGVDWQFGVWSPTYKRFTQMKQGWCNDEWDIQRRRGLRETTRVTVTRDG